MNAAHGSFRISFELSTAPVMSTPSDAGRSVRHWFELSEGWYDLTVSERHLFHSHNADPRGVDYYIARLWEDLIEIAPSVCDEVPASLAARTAVADRWIRWVDTVRELVNDDERCAIALSWWDARQLHTTYLRPAPVVHFWCTSERMSARWYYRTPNVYCPQPIPPSSEGTFGVETFRDEIARFDRDFLNAMLGRIEMLANDVTHLRNDMEIAGLLREHRTRCESLATAERNFVRVHSWSDVLAAVEELESRVGAVLG